jgi:hypothetical protein
MKTAKEWAESVVRVEGVDAILEDDSGYICVDGEQMYPEEERETATGIILRLVERVQADARAPLEAEVARLRVENDRLNAEHVDYRAFIANANDMLAEEHEQIGKANQ